MITFEINWWAFLVVIAFNILLGFVWYAKGVFGTTWMMLIGKTPEQLKEKQGSAMAPMPILAAIGAFALAQVVQWTDAGTFVDGMLVGLWVWLGFYFAPVLMNALFSQKPLKLFWIESLYQLVVMMVGGIIFALWTL